MPSGGNPSPLQAHDCVSKAVPRKHVLLSDPPVTDDVRSNVKSKHFWQNHNGQEKE